MAESGQSTPTKTKTVYKDIQMIEMEIPTVPNPAVPLRRSRGRRAIPIEYIPDNLKRGITFSKRKKGLQKKAYEISVLTGSQTLLVIMAANKKVYLQYTEAFKPLADRLRNPNNSVIKKVRAYGQNGESGMVVTRFGPTSATDAYGDESDEDRLRDVEIGATMVHPRSRKRSRRTVPITTPIESTTLDRDFAEECLAIEMMDNSLAL